MTKTLSPLAKERNRILEQMNPELQDVARKIEKRVVVAAKGMIKVVHQQGQLLVDVMEQEAKYGADAVTQLSEYLNVNNDEIYFMRNFAVTYTEEEVVELFAETLDNGNPWTIKHVKALVGVSSDKKRETLYKRAKREGLSANALHDLVQGTKSRGERAAGQGRKPAKPKTVPAAAQQVVKKTAEITNRWEGWEETLFDALDDLGPDEFTDTLAKDLATADANLENLIKDAQEARKKLGRGLKRYDNISGKTSGKSKPATAKEVTAKRSSKKKATKKKATKKSK